MYWGVQLANGNDAIVTPFVKAVLRNDEAILVLVSAERIRVIGATLQQDHRLPIHRGRGGAGVPGGDGKITGVCPRAID